MDAHAAWRQARHVESAPRLRYSGFLVPISFRILTASAGTSGGAPAARPVKPQHVVQHFERARRQRARRARALQRRRERGAGGMELEHQIVVVFADLLRLLVARVVEPREPDLLDADRPERLFAVHEPAEMIVVLMGADHHVERRAASSLAMAVDDLVEAGVEAPPFRNDPQSISIRLLAAAGRERHQEAVAQLVAADTCGSSRRRWRIDDPWYCAAG